MGKIIETLIDRFDTGIVNNPRSKTKGACQIVSNFDVLTDGDRMIPYRSSESGDVNASTSQKQNFCLARRTGTTYSLYSLGVKSGVSTAEINYKDLTTGATSDLDDSDWSATSNQQAASGATNFNLFVYYRYSTVANSRIFGASGGTRIWSYDPTGTEAFDDAGHNLTYTDIAQGMVHSKDDILYIPYDNKIAKNNQGSWTDAALTIPSQYKITSICEYGNYIAVAAVPLAKTGSSIVYLWDRDTSLATLSECVNWGDGELKILEEIDGVLIGISGMGGFISGASSLKDRIIFRYLSVTNAIRFKTIFDNTFSGSGAPQLLIAKQKLDNRLYFMMRINIGGVQRDGVWSIGRSSPQFPMTLIHERTPNNDTALAVGAGLKNFIFVDDYCFISYQDTNYALQKTNDSSTAFTATSIYETTRVIPKNSGHLLYAEVMTEPLPTAGQVVLKYKADTDSSWTTIFTNTTDNSMYHGAINIESSGVPLPRFNEIQFRIESTGNAVITGLYFAYEEIENKLFKRNI